MIRRVNFSGWNRFWFASADPTVLGLIRICCGAITTYTIFAYSFMLQDFMGKDSWYGFSERVEPLRQRSYSAAGVLNAPVDMSYAPAVPTTGAEHAYFDSYKAKWSVAPPPPFPKSNDEEAYLDDFKSVYGHDLRIFGIKMPRNEDDDKLQYIADYMSHPANVRKLPPPAYPADAKESEEIFAFMKTHAGLDPRLVIAIGQPSWSIWFHVTDPASMMVVHGLAVLAAFLFTIGFGTRVTSALTWIASLWYIHRNPVVLFGVDTMMVILLLYLMIGPSGAALSVDRLLARWWKGARPRVVNRWRVWTGRCPLDEGAVQPAPFSPTPMPSVSANFAMRMLQIHVCIVYAVSGLTKLQGPAWWNGTAVWGTLANFEFAPMTFEIGGVQIYTEFLRWLGGRQILLDAFLTGGTWFTLAFEIGYAFLIWRSSTRWVFLGAAILLHGFIGLLMGLKTFALMMLVMNMAFLRTEEVNRFLRFFAFGGAGTAIPGAASPQFKASALPAAVAKS